MRFSPEPICFSLNGFPVAWQLPGDRGIVQLPNFNYINDWKKYEPWRQLEFAFEE